MSRLKPSFFIIGERKCGTSSLFRYLCHHPQVLPGRVKESNFFSRSKRYIETHLDEYFEMFPSLDDETAINRWLELDDQGKIFSSEIEYPIHHDVDYITGEASANVFSTVSPKKFHKYLPSIKLIIMVRDPVERAFSHHAMHQRFKKEGRLPFQFVTSLSLSLVWERLIMKAGLDGPYISPGRYAHYLRKWTEFYDEKKIFVVRTEDLDDQTTAKAVMDDLCRFLEIGQCDFSDILGKRFNTSGSTVTDTKAANSLYKFYEPHTHSLEQMIGKKMNWKNGV